MQNTNSISLEYLAGFIDGEGCFNFSSTRDAIFPRILITNTNIDILLKIKNQYGGDISITTVKNKCNWKPRGTWRLSWTSSVLLAMQLKPYLHIKSNQVILFEKWLEASKSKSINKQQLYFDLKCQMNVLNKKGTLDVDVDYKIMLSKLG